MKKVGKTTRPFRHDLNQITYDYTVEVRNRFKRLDPIDRVPDEVWMEVQEAYTSLLASFIRGQTEEAKRSTIPQQLKQEPYYRNVITMKKQKVMSQMKGLDKITEKQLNEVEIGNLPEKGFRIMLVKMNSGSRKKNEGKD